ncbi:hypothetical protein HZ326_28599 [Fusarium oxysporum f. sp. albedinis]|nr:hypothetical protein HZ326_28599 [Fusarium oxysporum f. sp. albedinis]
MLARPKPLVIMGWTTLVRPEESRHQRKETIRLWHGTERSAAAACSGPYFPVTKVVLVHEFMQARYLTPMHSTGLCRWSTAIPEHH